MKKKKKKKNCNASTLLKAPTGDLPPPINVDSTLIGWSLNVEKWLTVGWISKVEVNQNSTLIH